MYLSTRLTADENVAVGMTGFVITSSKQMVVIVHF